MQEKTIKSYQDEKIRLQLILITDVENHRLFYIIRKNRKQVMNRFSRIENACRMFQAEVYKHVMQTELV